MPKLQAVSKAALNDAHWDPVVLVGTTFEFSGWPEVGKLVEPLKALDVHFGRGASLPRHTLDPVQARPSTGTTTMPVASPRPRRRAW